MKRVITKKSPFQARQINSSDLTSLFADPAAYLVLNHLHNCYPTPILLTLITLPILHTPLLDVDTTTLFALQHHWATCPLMMLMTQTQMMMVSQMMTM
jgi:hypothetical protein